MLPEKSVRGDIHLITIFGLEHLSSIDIQHVQAGAAHGRRTIVGDIKVERAVAVDVRQRHRRASELANQSRICDFLEMALAVVEEEPGASAQRVHQQIKVAVTINID